MEDKVSMHVEKDFFFFLLLSKLRETASPGLSPYFPVPNAVTKTSEHSQTLRMERRLSEEPAELDACPTADSAAVPAGGTLRRLEATAMQLMSTHFPKGQRNYSRASHPAQPSIWLL